MIFFKITGFALSVLLYPIISIIIYVYFFKKSKIFNLKDIFLFNFTFSNALKSIIKLGIYSLILGILDQVIVLSIRSLIIKNLGIESNGIYQCVAGISNNYINLLYMSLGAYILPILSEMSNNFDRINVEINNVFRLTLLIIFPIIAVTFVFREYIILILYTSKFLASSNLMIYNFAGDYFKALSWILGAWLIPCSKFRLWLILGVIYNINYMVIFMLLNFFVVDIQNVVLAYSFAGLIHFILNLIFIKKVSKFKFSFDAFKLFLFSSICLSIIFIVSEFKIALGYFFIIPIFIFWIKVSIKKEEFYKVLSLIKIKP